MLTVVLEKRLQSLEDDVLGFSWETIGRIDNSVKSFLEEDIQLAREIIEKTDEINKESYKIEHGCLKVLGLPQPLAKDLRLGAALLRTSIELERINNLSAYIARYAIDAAESPRKCYKPPHIEFMSQTVQDMLKDAVGALLNEDVQLLKRSTRSYVNLQDFYNQMFSEYDEITHGGDRKSVV
jgi:phosphate transport system protein